MAGAWKTVRVFISSTFRDMHAERDHLVKIVFPRLREWCAQRRLHLVDIDLRWGVTREEAENGKASEICLREIDECRPFFICLLGEQYGWVPPDDPDDHSITHREILHALGTPNTLSKLEAYFYFRDALALPESSEAPRTAEEERYANAYFTREERHRQKLASVKADIRRTFAANARVFEYPCRWDPGARNVSTPGIEGEIVGLETFGERVEHDLCVAVSAQFKDHIEALSRTPDEIALEQARQSDFISSRTQFHVPDERTQQAITDYVCGHAAKPCVLSGFSGAGKSSALAYWMARNVAMDAIWRLRTSAKAIIFRSVGASTETARFPSLLRSIALELKMIADASRPETPAPTPPTPNDETPDRAEIFPEVSSDPAELLRRWPKMLEAASALCDGGVAIIIDGIDQLGEDFDPGMVSWAPTTLAPNIKFLISAIDGDEKLKGGVWLRALRERQFSEIRQQPLSDDMKRAIARGLPSVYAKSLDEAQLALLLTNPATGNPLFLSVALQELRIFGSFDQLERAIAALPRAKSDTEADRATGALFESIMARLETETDREAPGLVARLFGLLASSSNGLSEQELEALTASLLPGLGQSKRNAALQVALRQVRPYLSRAWDEGVVLVRFFHNAFIRAARERYLRDKKQRLELCRQLVVYFDAIPIRFDAITTALRKASQLAKYRLQLAGWEFNPQRRQDGQALGQLLQDWRFLEAKYQCGLVYDLSEELENAGRSARLRRADKKRIAFIGEAIRRNIGFLDRNAASYPQALFQCLWNSLWWHDAQPAAGHFRNRAYPAPPLFGSQHAWVEQYRAKREALYPGFAWLRQLRPNPARLGEGPSWVFSGFSRAIHAMAYSNDGRYLMVSSVSPAIALFDLKTGKEIYRIEYVGGSVARICISPNNQYFAVGFSTRIMKDTIRLYSLPSAQHLHTLTTEKETPGAMDFSADSKLFQSEAQVWDIVTGALLPQSAAKRFRSPKMWRPLFAPAHWRMLPRSARNIQSHQTNIRCSLLSPDGSLIATAAGSDQVQVYRSQDDFDVHVTPLRNARRRAALQGHTETIDGLAFSPNGECLLTSVDRRGSAKERERGSTLMAWSCKDWRLLGRSPNHQHAIQNLFFSRDGKRFLTWGMYGASWLWDLERLPRGKQLTDEALYMKRVELNEAEQTFWTSGGSAAGDKAPVRVFEFKEGREIAYFTNMMSPWAFSRDREFVATTERLSGYSSMVDILAMQDGPRIAASIPQTDGAVEAMAFDATGAVLAYSHGPGAISLHKWRANESVRLDHAPHHSAVEYLCFSEDNAMLTSASRDEIKIFDLSTLQVARAYAGQGEVKSLARDPTGPGLWALSTARELRILDGASDLMIAAAPGSWHNLSAHPSRSIWAGTTGGLLCAWELEHAPLRSNVS